MNKNFVTLRTGEEVLESLASKTYQLLRDLYTDDIDVYSDLIVLVLKEDVPSFESEVKLIQKGILTSDKELLPSMRIVILAALEISEDGNSISLVNPVQSNVEENKNDQKTPASCSNIVDCN